MLALIEILLVTLILPGIVAWVSSARTRVRRFLIFFGVAFMLFAIDAVVTATANELMGLLAVIFTGVVAVIVVAPTDANLGGD